ncbi:uncharacterized protein BDW43DRAFT_95280 [Aspergillus alliaceus]|uniref:uncharacterized protein n=1 Tax=Petromyces alliaceus TaxID=209559 RepID=UPI0012A5AB17|nr:uncharacterized protein BDW43DRAFT_95280 [Aspergillus alliaceus]KAB8233148.1 hypothetical protein BDW43DRAFT_95280 [Aspergillus alliaceus]
MSDDEDYYDEYEEDIFWIEEPEPEIADDLAATANYDAIFFEDPSLEVEEYFSDWDDHSDDYYDEDPTAVRRQRAMGLWPNKQSIKELNGLLSPKHKLPTQEGPKLPLQKTDTASFQGTVWRTPNDTPLCKLYEPGDGEKVALLKNWREVFRSSHPAIGRMRMRKLDPSDMAPPLTRMVARKTDSSDDTSAASSLENLRETDIGSDACSKSTTPLESWLSPPLTVHSHRVIKSSSDMPVNSKMLEHEYPIEDDEAYDDPMGMAAESDILDATTEEQDTSSKKPNSSAVPPTRTRKRKASDALDQAESHKGQTTRSKRVASKKVGDTADPPPEASGPVRRSARNRATK